jgi:hypothetical protein
MEINLSEISFHDSELIKVIENTKTDDLIFNVDWPKDWENSVFVNANLIFEHVLNYEVHEGPFVGSPTILEVNVIGEQLFNNVKRIKIKIETNAGYRSLFCTNMKLIEIEKTNDL